MNQYNMERNTTKFLEKYGGTYIGGFKMRLIDGDYDWAYLKSVRYKNNRQNYERMLRVKGENECDYDRTEYDCNGSTRRRFEIVRNGRYIWMKYWESKDV